MRGVIRALEEAGEFGEDQIIIKLESNVAAWRHQVAVDNALGTSCAVSRLRGTHEPFHGEPRRALVYEFVGNDLKYCVNRFKSVALPDWRTSARAYVVGIIKAVAEVCLTLQRSPDSRPRVTPPPPPRAAVHHRCTAKDTCASTSN